VNEFYRTQKLFNQTRHLLPREDVIARLAEVTQPLIEQITTLEPFGSANPEPILKSEGLVVTKLRRMGSVSQHVKLDLQDTDGTVMQMIAFSAPEHFFVEPGEKVTVWYQPTINEWNGMKSVEGRLLNIEIL
jgi:single-stranded-DNA-specific exonuclease